MLRNLMVSSQNKRAPKKRTHRTRNTRATAQHCAIANAQQHEREKTRSGRHESTWAARCTRARAKQETRDHVQSTREHAQRVAQESALVEVPNSRLSCDPLRGSAWSRLNTRGCCYLFFLCWSMRKKTKQKTTNVTLQKQRDSRTQTTIASHVFHTAWAFPHGNFWHLPTLADACRRLRQAPFYDGNPSAMHSGTSEHRPKTKCSHASVLQ